jgi:hypothetical protein
MSEAYAGFPGGQFRPTEPSMLVHEDSSLEMYGLRIDIVEKVTASAAKDLWELDSYPWLTECLDMVHSTISIENLEVDPTITAIHDTLMSLPEGAGTQGPRKSLIRARDTLKGVLYPPGTFRGNISGGQLTRCHGRKFFCTKDGRIGIGHPKLQKDDVLYVMHGAYTPWALRPWSSLEKPGEVRPSDCDGKRTEKEAFELIGSTYLPNFLKGEALEGKSIESMERFKII